MLTAQILYPISTACEWQPSEELADRTAGVESADNDLFSEGGMGAVPQRDADLLHLWTAYTRAQTPSQKAAALAALHAEVDRRDAVDSNIRSAVWALLQQPAVLAQLQVLRPSCLVHPCMLCTLVLWACMIPSL